MRRLFPLLIVTLALPFFSARGQITPSGPSEALPAYMAIREWTVNQRPQAGRLAGMDPRTGDAWLLDPSGKWTRVRSQELSNTDRDWLKTTGAAADTLGTDRYPLFVKPTLMRRDQFPIISQADYAGGGGNCVPSSFCNFLLWWDQANFLPIPKKGDFDKKAEWIHERMGRYFDTRNNSGTSYADAMEGICRYFDDDLREIATFRMTQVLDIRPEVLCKYVTGVNACLLSISTHQRARHVSGHAVALTELTPEGDITFCTWGAKFKGRLKPIQPDRRPDHSYNEPALAKIAYEIVLTDLTSLPERFREDPPRFTLDGSMGDRLLVIKPYRFFQEGKRALPPPDGVLDDRQAVVVPGTAPASGGTTPFKPRTLPAPSFPIAFAHPVEATTIWPLSDGRRVPVRIVDHTFDAATLITASKARVPVKIEFCNAEQKVVLAFRQTLEGTPIKWTSYGLEYNLSSPQSGRTFRFLVESDGSRFRVEYPKEYRTITVDPADGAFFYEQTAANPPERLIGRLPENLRKIDHACSSTDETLLAFFKTLAAGSTDAVECPWPARSLAGIKNATGELSSFPMDFALVECPHAMTALHLVLSGQRSPGSAFQMTREFLPSEIRVPNTAAWLGGCFAARLLPVRATFGERPSSPAVKLSLLGATPDAEFPPDYFKIPEEARKLDPGTVKTSP